MSNMPDRVRLDPDFNGWEDQVIGWAEDNITEDEVDWPVYIRLDAPELVALVEAAKVQLAYMDFCNDRGDLERNLRAALEAWEALE